MLATISARVQALRPVPMTAGTPLEHVTAFREAAAPVIPISAERARSFLKDGINGAVGWSGLSEVSSSLAYAYPVTHSFGSQPYNEDRRIDLSLAVFQTI